MIVHALLIALQLVIFHTVDGHEVAINPAQVTNMIAAKDDQDNKLFTNSVRCVINLTDGRFITVVESCDEVKRRLEAAK